MKVFGPLACWRMRRVRYAFALMFAVPALIVPHAAHAVFNGDMSPKARSGDADYADGIDAWNAQNWEAVVTAMNKVVARRPWHDNAWTRLGYAYRKLQRYDESLDAYSRALKLNPGLRPALEYLGEAYLSLDRLSDARQMLTRLDEECKRIALVFTDGDFKNGCAEYRELQIKIDDYTTTGKTPSHW